MSDQAPNPPPSDSSVLEQWQRFLSLWNADAQSIHTHIVVLTLGHREYVQAIYFVTMKLAFQQFPELKDEKDFLPRVTKILHKVVKKLPRKRRSRFVPLFVTDALGYCRRILRNMRFRMMRIKRKITGEPLTLQRLPRGMKSLDEEDDYVGKFPIHRPGDQNELTKENNPEHENMKDDLAITKEEEHHEP